ncbi:MAG: hypothetical protein JNJ54_28630 [Myxococcaceae bacterium]|nr:hypothetical protein [Myxococcaceae bacterium]
MRACRRCERELPRGALHFRFVLALEGEAEVIDAPAVLAADPEALLRELEAVEPDELEAQIHEDISGVLCPACRAALRAFLHVARPLQ